jgi:AcrR family transcriptional regulator
MGRPAEPEKSLEIARRAVMVMQREGFGVSMSRLATVLEVKRPTLLYHFPTKGHIVEAALEDLLRDQTQFVLTHIQDVRHPLDRLYAQLCAMHEFQAGQEARVLFLSQAIAATGGKRMREIIDIGNNVFAPYREAMLAMLQQGVDDGTVAPCSPAAVLATVRALTDGLLIQRVMTGLDLRPVHEFIWAHILEPLKIAPEKS